MPSTKVVHSVDQTKTITFTESSHTYMMSDNGDPSRKVRLSSVTGWLYKWFKPFDRERISKMCARKRGVPVEQILAEWDKECEESCTMGTRMHEVCEDMLLGHTPRNTPANEKEQVIFSVISSTIPKFKDRFTNLEPEKIIVDPTLNLAGTIDLFANDKTDGAYVLVDWKTNKRLRTENEYGEKALNPIAHLDSCELVQYSLQLGLYEFILKHAGYIAKNAPVKKYLVHFTHDGKLEMFKAMPLDMEIRDLLIENFISINKANEDIPTLSKGNGSQYQLKDEEIFKL